MFPWLAFGHMIPNLELAKLIAQKGHHRLPKPSLNTLDINFVNLPLPKVQNLPENAEANTDIPYDVFEHLKEAYDVLQEPLKLFYDFAPFWVGSMASKLGIKALFSAFALHPSRVNIYFRNIHIKKNIKIG
ncbi:putative UDP-rhamnose:rhamnosyltransferase 1 [Glycine soja]|uniref:Putative UDP-rhamnose:rhamnosyltransferase 1 n=1 Tax=Glycine soja TaxID=3848 RepID=A0A445JKX6_GLYSO|nr:putative UDP-rhamnose:rhamnosyltransferase 1 [Glycine soja]